jgi:hypothetical protein
MPDLSFPRLQYVVLDGHEAEVEFAVFSADFGDGYGARALVGSPTGLRSWRIQYGHLARVPHRPGGRHLSEEAAADYVWNFFQERMAEGNGSFVIRCPRDRKDYLVGFVETKLVYREAFRNRFYTTGIEVRQRRERGVSFNEDGSLGEFFNPDVI